MKRSPPLHGILPWSDTLSPRQLQVAIAILESMHFDGRQMSIQEMAERLTGNRKNYNAIRQCLEKLVKFGLIELQPGMARCIKVKCRIEFFPESGLTAKPSV